MLRSSKWINPYIILCNKGLKNLYPFTSDQISAAEREQLRSCMDSYQEIYCELGSGSGGHLIERARRSPHALFVGFELRFKRVYRSAEKALHAGASNALFLRTDAHSISELLPADSLSGVYVNFPDPWDKKRWNKHRLLTAEFLECIAALVKTDGFFAYKTDHRKYFDEISQHLRASGSFQLEAETHAFHSSEFADDNVPSEFENLFQSKYLPICYLRAVKIGGIIGKTVL